MKNRFVAAATAVLVIGGAVGCSSTQVSPKQPKPGTLPPGTAALTMNDKDLGLTDSVQCTPDEWLTTIRTSHEASGVTVMVSNAQQLTAEFVRIRNVNGFTGSYDRDLQGKAAVTMTGATYTITGAAMGFNNAKPSELTTETFTIRVSC
ncbi:lipoprotein LpqH [Mycobacterium sp. SM1]|uniref:lipoprotein LpqH n=1 Tax=Mycobacterium sp. SM1 TaxID=2816243 RepID=UPI001BCD01F5|nr:lipoprotein LpqH [Mycobacterium sp. SM1]MBS4728620.1 lipoprotein LpqH [Mycobacterium sp. SM1]